MLKLTPGANKANAILIRIVLFLIGGIAIITGMCLFSGDMWMLTPRAEQYQPATGDLPEQKKRNTPQHPVSNAFSQKQGRTSVRPFQDIRAAPSKRGHQVA